MTDQEIDDLVTATMGGQPAEYLCSPYTSAFVAVGLDAATVSASLERLAAAGHVEHVVETLTAVDGNGDPVLDENGSEIVQVSAYGYQLTKEGNDAAATLPPVDELATPIEPVPIPVATEDEAVQLIDIVLQAGSFDDAKAALSAWKQGQGGG